MMQTDVKMAYVAGSGQLVSTTPARLKGLTVTSGTSSLRNMAVCDPATAKSGTYSQTGTTITCTIANHGLTNGQRVFVDCTTGTSRDGVYEITYVDASTFTVTAANTVSTSGNVTAYPTLHVEIDTYSTVGLPIKIPGEGIYCPNGFFVGVGSSVTALVYYG